MSALIRLPLAAISLLAFGFLLFMGAAYLYFRVHHWLVWRTVSNSHKGLRRL